MRFKDLNSKSEYQLIMEFIGFRNLVIVGVAASLYFYSGFRNFYEGMSVFTAFSPYYALHFGDGGQVAANLWTAFSAWVVDTWNFSMHILSLRLQLFRDYLFENVFPIINTHPIMGFIIFGMVGCFIAAFVLYTMLFLFKKSMSVVVHSTVKLQSVVKSAEKQEDLWAFDPSKKPSDDQLKQMRKNLERFIQRAPAMGGSVPKNADVSIRELAQRNKESEFHYRCAVYVMGPIKGTTFDNHFETPLALDQIKKISTMMGPAAIHETLPLDLVILRSKKGTKDWEVEPGVPAVTIGKSYPLKVLESLMLQNRNYFIWDNRANKSITGYGQKWFTR